MLGAHPDVSLTHKKELNFWHRAEQLTYEWYSAAVADHDPSAVVGDISPSYTLLKADAIADLRSRYPDVRVFFNVRNPVDRIWSRARHLVREANLDVMALSEAELETYVFNPRSVRISDYATHLTRWQVQFPGDEILVSRFEELVKEPAVYFRRLCIHIGIDPDVLPQSAMVRQRERSDSRPLPEAHRARLHEMMAEPMARFRDQFGIDYT